MKTNQEHPGILALREILRRMRSDDQDGYSDVGEDGKFTGTAYFSGRGLGMATPEQLDALFDLAGIVPDPIAVNGSCSECVHGDARGGDLGWGRPCCGCSRPKMTHFVPLASVKDSALRLTDDQAQMLGNLLGRVPGEKRTWWATGIVTAKQFSGAWNKQIDHCYRIREAMKERGLISGIDDRVTNKGERALALHKRKRAA
jgi:hypothetical protein